MLPNIVNTGDSGIASDFGDGVGGDSGDGVGGDNTTDSGAGTVVILRIIYS